MRPDVRQEIDFSVKAFDKLVWPHIHDALGGGELKSVEAAGSVALDVAAGIDAVQVLRTGCRTIAQRVRRVWIDDSEQAKHRYLPSFTIRSDLARGGATEWEKRLQALQEGYALPTLTVQSYVYHELNQLANVAVVHTAAFIGWCRQHPELLTRKENKSDRNGFYNVLWADLLASGEVPIYEQRREFKFWRESKTQWHVEPTRAVREQRRIPPGMPAPKGRWI